MCNDLTTHREHIAVFCHLKKKKEGKEKLKADKT